MKHSLLVSPNRILPALVTPLTPDGQLDAASAERLIDHLYRAGVGGLYVGGSTGEGIYLDITIRRRIAEVAMSSSKGRGRVIVHVGAIEAAHVFELADHAAQIGAAAVSSIPPFAGGYSWNEVQTFYRELAAGSRLPVVAYHIPVLTGQQRTIDELASLLSIENIAGCKFTDYNLYAMQRLIARLSPEQVMYNGHDEMLSLGLQFGAHGGIGTTYNIMPDLFVQIAQHCREGRFSEAVAVQKQINDVIEPLLTYHGLAATKQILYWQGLIDRPRCASPRAGLVAEQQSDLRRRLAGTAIGPTLIRS